VRAQVALSLLADFENYSVFKPGPHRQPTVEAMLDQVVSWSKALQPLRSDA